MLQGSTGPVMCMGGVVLRWAVATAAILFALPAVAQSPTVNWAGLYVGVQAGLGSSSFSATGYAAADSLVAGPLTVTQSFGGGGALAGVYGGFNFQNAQDFVLGGEADFNLTQLSAMSGQILDLHAGNGGCNNTTSSYVCLGPVNSGVKWYGTVRGTFG